MPTDVALELSTIDSLSDLFNVVVEVELFSLFLTEIFIACILVFLNRGLGGVHPLTGFGLALDRQSFVSIVILRGRQPLFSLYRSLKADLSWCQRKRRCSRLVQKI